MPDTGQATSLRAMTLNLWAQHGDWPTRRGVMYEGLRQLGPDYLLVRCQDHGPTLRITGCHLALNRPVAGVMASDHYGVLADLHVHAAS